MYLGLFIEIPSMVSFEVDFTVGVLEFRHLCYESNLNINGCPL